MRSEKSAGRPKIEEVYKFRTRAWFIAVSRASGMNASTLEVLFADPEKQMNYKLGNRPGLWNKYQKGIISPKVQKDKKREPLQLVDRVEKRFPGTKQWFTMPFWCLLSFDPLDMPALKTIFLNFSPEVRELIVIEKYNQKNSFWRLQKDPAELYQELVAVGTVEAATAILALIKEAETTQNQTQHKLGLRAWVHCVQKLTGNPILGPLLSDINKHIEKRFTDTVYFSTGETQEKYRMGTAEVQSVFKEQVPVTSNSNSPANNSRPLLPEPWRMLVQQFRP